ncbi:MAG: amidoligase family protein [Gammaproteobacteria bacterium]|nr:amidoligase family protein [Gammaproteobacteria bacterium]
MKQVESPFKSPPVATGSDGTPRKVGFELEFTGLTLDQTCEALQSALGGTTGSETGTVAEQAVDVDGLGKFNIELDWDFLKRKAAEYSKDEDVAELLDLLSQAALQLVPMEVVCPPIPLTELDRLQPLVEKLRDAGAQGTDDSPIAAYGVHINTEIPALDAATLFAYLRAFSLLQWWLVKKHDVDTTRRISPYIDLYPEDYLEQLFSRKDPDMDQIFDDYLEHNDSRNRALDMLPMLAEINESRVRETVDDPRINPRPTFHYRLPNCEIEKPGWSLATPWNVWLVVERLAQKQEWLDELSTAWLDARRPVIGVSRSDWVEKIDQWLKDHELV